MDDLHDGEIKFGGELEVAFVVGGDGHDGAGAVAHHDVVGDPDGDLLAVDGVGGEGAGGDAAFVLVEVAAVHVGLGGALLDVGFDGVLLLGAGDFGDEGVLGGEDHVGGAEEGVGAGGEDCYFVTGLIGLADGIRRHGEDHLCSFGAADPVALEELDGVGPVEGFEFVDEALGVFGDAQHPLAEGAAFDGVAFGFPFLDFLVGEDGAEVGRPVDGGLVDVGEADVVDLRGGPALCLQFGNGGGLAGVLVEVGAVELEEDPLGPADVVGIGGIDLAIPVVGEAEGLELAAEVGDVGLGGDAGVLAGLDGVLFGGQAEGVPAHGVEDVEAVHALVAADDVGGGVAFRVTDVEPGAGRVGEHVEDVILRLGGIEVGIARSGGAEGFLFEPALLPLGFEFVEGEGFASVVAHGVRGKGPDGGKWRRGRQGRPCSLFLQEHWVDRLGFPGKEGDGGRSVAGGGALGFDGLHANAADAAFGIPLEEEHHAGAEEDRDEAPGEGGADGGVDEVVGLAEEGLDGVEGAALPVPGDGLGGLLLRGEGLGGDGGGGVVTEGVLADRAGGGGADVGLDLEGAEAVGAGEGGEAFAGQDVALESAGGGGCFSGNHRSTRRVWEEMRRRAKRTNSDPAAVAPKPRRGQDPSLC